MRIRFLSAFFAIWLGAHSGAYGNPICTVTFSRHGPLIASEWGQHAETQALAKVYSELPLVFRSRTKLNPEPQSLSLQDPELELILDDINTFMVNEAEFIQRVEAMGGAIRSKRDLFAFFENRLQLFESGMRAYAKRIEARNPQVAADIRTSASEGVSLEVSRLKGGLEGIQGADGGLIRDFTFAEFLEMTRMSANWMRSKLVELHVLGTRSGVKSFSKQLRHSPFIQSALAQTKVEQAALLSKYPQHIQHLAEKYPELIKNGRITRREKQLGRPLKPSEVLHEVFEWIQDKEIDVTLGTEVREVWLEVKMNKNPFTHNQLQKDMVVKKVYTQALGLRQILQFLKIEKQVQLQIWATQGFEPAAAEEMKKISVQVLN